ncbi:hypothetical protein LI221_09255 [Faecalimonas umbilicata]|nr:hypothetical protein [Faecalimonas umbilicata]
MIQTKQNKRGRPTLDEQQKIDRETLKQLFLSHTPEALETIVSIMKHSMDSTSRLKASMFILNKIVPDGFIFEDETNHNITVHIVTQDSEEDGLSYEEQTKLIREVENEPDAEDEDWGEEIYTP